MRYVGSPSSKDDVWPYASWSRIVSVQRWGPHVRYQETYGWIPAFVATTFMASPSSAAQPATAVVAASTRDSNPIIEVGSRVVTQRGYEGREDAGYLYVPRGAELCVQYVGLPSSKDDGWLYASWSRIVSAQKWGRHVRHQETYGWIPAFAATTFMASPSSAAQPATAAIAASTTDFILIIAVGSRVITYRRFEGHEDCHT